MNRVSAIAWALPDPEPDDVWQAESIIYGRIELIGTGQKMTVGYNPINSYDLMDIGGFVTQKLVERHNRKHPPPGPMLAPVHGRDAPPKGPLDFNVAKNCYVVFELSENLKNWQFRAQDPITTKADLEDVYFDLHTKFDSDDGTCCLVYFSVRLRQEKRFDNINLHIMFKNDADGTTIELIFDPDIPNPGNPPPPHN